MFRPALAMSLTNLGNCLSRLGLRHEALAAAQEAADLYKGLAAVRPDAFRQALATSLNTLGICLSELGRPEEAVAIAHEVTELFRGLAEARPDAFCTSLAISLTNLASRLRDLGQQEEALAKAHEAVVLLSQLLPHTYAEQMRSAVQTYAELCKVTGRPREEDLIAPIIHLLAKSNQKRD
jgi:tetratricopeptide (TPR) repeat protein